MVVFLIPKSCLTSLLLLSAPLLTVAGGKKGGGKKQSGKSKTFYSKDFAFPGFEDYK